MSETRRNKSFKGEKNMNNLPFWLFNMACRETLPLPMNPRNSVATGDVRIHNDLKILALRNNKSSS